MFQLEFVGGNAAAVNSVRSVYQGTVNSREVMLSNHNDFNLRNATETKCSLGFIKKNPTRCNNVSKIYYYIFI